MRWLITGASRGLGRELAAEAVSAGHVVIGTSRDGRSDLHGVRAVTLDVTDREQVEQAVTESVRLAGGRLDVVVNNAGYGLLGAVEETSDAEAEEVLDTNLLGPLRVIRSALPVLRAQESGTIVNISSLAAIAPLAGSGVYAAAKAGLLALSGALAHEVDPFGVRVMTVVLGSFRTGFLSNGSVRMTAATLSAYGDVTGTITARVAQNDGRQAGDPKLAARLIVEAIECDDSPELLVIGADAVERSRTEIGRMVAEIDRWEARSRATAGGDAGRS